MEDILTDKIKHMSDLPGVYRFKDARGDLLYIGKAKSLKNRVNSYFRAGATHNIRIRIMVSLVRDVETIVTNTEAEALILESQLIKAHQPRYNVAQKDDKSYPFFKLTMGEMYPRLFLVREHHDSRAEYFGPYTSVRDARQVLELVDKHFLLRTSKMKLDGTKTYRPCINFQLKRCLAPCRGDVKTEDYAEVAALVRLFLQGKGEVLIPLLDGKMKDAAAGLDFERAANLRDQISAIKRTFEKQLILTDELDDQDVYALQRDEDLAGVQVMFLRHGRLLGTDFFYFPNAGQITDENILGQVLNRIYTGDFFEIPHQILLPLDYPDQEELSEILREVSQHRVLIQVPKQGKKKLLIRMAEQNAIKNLAEKKRSIKKSDEVLEAVQHKLHLKFLPYTVESFDISNISGTDTVASLVSWKNNQAYKDGYRKYKIQTVQGPNDFESMKEVLTRRYLRTLTGEMPLPNLILIDGGKGQLNIAVEVLKQLNISLDDVDVIGLAKGRSQKRRKQQRPDEEDYEYVVKPNQKNEIRLQKNSSVLYFLQNIRDETHRFAITFHRELRDRNTLSSALDDIPGIGKVRRMALLKHFGSLQNIQQASLEQLLEFPGMSQALAQSIQEFFRRQI